MAGAPEPPLSELLWSVAAARLLLGPGVSVQAPPNLTPEPDDSAPAPAGADLQAGWRLLIEAGINDFGVGGWVSGCHTGACRHSPARRCLAPCSRRPLAAGASGLQLTKQPAWLSACTAAGPAPGPRAALRLAQRCRAPLQSTCSAPAPASVTCSISVPATSRCASGPIPAGHLARHPRLCQPREGVAPPAAPGRRHRRHRPRAAAAPARLPALPEGAAAAACQAASAAPHGWAARPAARGAAAAGGGGAAAGMAGYGWRAGQPRGGHAAAGRCRGPGSGQLLVCRGGRGGGRGGCSGR